MSDSRLFVLQVWNGPGRFRAALRAVEETETLHFGALQALCEHIAGMAKAAPTAGPLADAAPVGGSLVAPRSLGESAAVDPKRR